MAQGRVKLLKQHQAGSDARETVKTVVASSTRPNGPRSRKLHEGEPIIDQAFCSFVGHVVQRLDARPCYISISPSLLRQAICSSRSKKPGLFHAIASNHYIKNGITFNSPNQEVFGIFYLQSGVKQQFFNPTICSIFILIFIKTDINSVCFRVNT